jgi:hypothetical protein
VDSRLAAEEPELGYTEAPAPRPRRHRGQISGSPHDGPSFYGVARAKSSTEMMRTRLTSNLAHAPFGENTPTSCLGSFASGKSTPNSMTLARRDGLARRRRAGVLLALCSVDLDAGTTSVVAAPPSRTTPCMMPGACWDSPPTGAGRPAGQSDAARAQNSSAAVASVQANPLSTRSVAPASR